MDLQISTEDLTRLYRFALLMTGDEVSAQQVFYDACMDCAARLGGYRNEDGRGVARAFATLPEEERAALAGLYTGLLPARGLAEALKMSLDQMGRVLKSARERLERAGLELGEPSLEQAL